MKILHISPFFYPAYVYGGPIETVYQLCRRLAEKNQVRVLTTDANGSANTLSMSNGRSVQLAENLSVYYAKRLMRNSVSWKLIERLSREIQWADVIHLSFTYSFPTIPTLLTAKFFGKPIVWSPRGALQRWNGSRRATLKSIWDVGCRYGAPKKMLLHVTSDDEEKDSLKRLPGLKTVMIPNGVEIPDNVNRIARNDSLRILYLGRIDPKKGIENLLKAGQILLSQGFIGGAWSLTIAGGGNREYFNTLRGKIDELLLSTKVKMIGETYGDAKRRLFESADLAVIPSHTESFGMVVAEALAHGVPVIASRGTPWKRVEDIGCGLWVDNTPEGLAGAIQVISKMPLSEMGSRGREWMTQEFLWEKSASEMVKVYETLVDR